MFKTFVCLWFQTHYTVIAQKANFNWRIVKLYFDFGYWISILIYLKNVYSPYVIFALLYDD